MAVLLEKNFPVEAGAFTTAGEASTTIKRTLKQLDSEVEVFAQACPMLVPLVENGRFEPGDIVVETIVAEYLQPLKEWNADTLMLGCTHYPLLRGIISSYMGNEVSLVDVGEQCAQWVADQLTARGMRTDHEGKGSHRYFVSDSPAGFCKTASLFLGEDVTADVSQIDITIY